MTRLTVPSPAARSGALRPAVRSAQRSAAPGGLELSARLRAIIFLAGAGMTLASAFALFRGLTGLAPAHTNARELAIIIHVASVLPAIPLGACLLLAQKGTALHKRLGRLWVGLMVMTALSAIFIRWDGGLQFGISPIHLFVPMTLWASFKLVRAARAGDMKTHRSEILSLYLGALMIPGLVAFVWEGRLMNVWLFG